MRHVAGQGVRHACHLLHRLFQALLVVAVLAAIVLGGLAWRLSQGPLELPWLVPHLEAAVPAPYHLAIGGVALTWEGLGDRVDRPVDLRLREVTLSDAQGGRILHTPSIEVSLSFLALLRGELRPRAIDIDGLNLRAWRRADGSAALDLSGADQPAAAAAPNPDPDSAGLLEAALAELARPPSGLEDGRLPGSGSLLHALRRVRLRHAEIAIVDRQLDTVWRISGAGLDLRRRPGGGMDATAGLALQLGAGQPGGQSLPFTASASLPPDGGDIDFQATLPPLVPAALAAAVPSLKPLAALDARLSLTLSGSIDTGLHTPRLQLTAGIGPGLLHIGAGALPLRAAKLEAEGSLSEFDLRILSLDVAPPAMPGTSPGPEGTGGPTSHITGWLHARRANGQFDAALSLVLDGLDFADLPALWPVGLGGPGARPWVTENIQAGQLRQLHLALALHAPEDFSDATITYINGAAAGHDLTVHWLRPVPPLVQGEALLRVTDPDVLRITVLSGVQSLAPLDAKPPVSKAAEPKTPAAQQLRLTDGEVVLSGLTGNKQFADISGDFTGPLPALLTVLGHPRLHLLDRRPIPLHDPAGQVAGQLAIAQLPLKDDLSIDDVHIQAGGHLTGVHLGGIAAGHDLDRGVLDLSVTNDGLSVQGAADLAGIAAKLKVEMDFRGGPPSQVIQSIAVQATPTATQLAGIGLATADMLSGVVGVQADMTSRRDGSDEVTVKADLTPAGLAVKQLHWSKPPGRQASAAVQVKLRQDRIIALEGLRAEGPGLDVRGRMDFVAGRPRRLQLQRLALGEPEQKPATDLTGSLAWPQQPGAPWVAVLDGPSLDASDEFTRDTAAPAKPPPAQPARPGPPWQVQARIARVLMADGQVLTGVVAQAQNNGELTTHATLSGATQGTGNAAGGRFQAAIAPQPGGRTLSASAADAGGLLRALGVLPDLYGGQMTLNGRYDDSRADHPLAGAVRITDFRLHNAPLMARLLQALSGYGIVSALQSPDLAFTELASQYRLTGDTLELAQLRANNASLGMTGKGRLDIARRLADMEGTIVPAYFLNSLLGRLPLVGKLLSPERGGGLIALNLSVRGPFSDPTVMVNPLSAVTPGFLRGLFDVFSSGDSLVPKPTPPGSDPPALPQAAPLPPVQPSPIPARPSNTPPGSGNWPTNG